jgi:hypothetical protein
MKTQGMMHQILEAEPTVSKASTVPKVSKKRGPRGPYKKNLNNSFLTTLYYIIISIIKYNKRFDLLSLLNWP